MASKNQMDAHKERLQQLRKKRGRVEDAFNTSNPSNRSRPATQEVQRQFSTQKSETVHVSGSIIETYQKQIQCNFETRSLDSKPTTYQREEDQTIQEIDLLQPKEHKRKREDNKHAQDFPPMKVKELEPQQLDSLVRSKHFTDFFNKSSKFLEKVLDHGDGDMIELLLKDGIKSKEIDSHNILSQPVTYYDPNFTANRVVTDIDWSTQISDLFLASYSQNEEGNIKDHVGVVLVWTPSLKNRPQFYCFCQSPVTSAKFFPYSNNTIIGGCYNGQLLLWDIRTKAMPVQRSGISSDGHKYPVNSLSIVGTQIANNVVSFSTDGTMGLWDVKQLNRPVRTTTKLTVNRPVRSTRQVQTQNVLANRSSVTSSDILGRNRDEPHSVNVTCCQFPLGDANKYYVGSLNGAMYRNATHNNSAENISIFDEHDGPISGISINNPSSEYQALSGLILTSSYDWTVKLWSPNNKDSLRTFEHSDDYIYDVDWNPSNPSIFATVNNDGVIDLFDLTRDLEQPIAHKKVNGFAQNKCKWNRDGSIIMSGDSAGNLHLSVLVERFRKIEGTRLDDFETILAQSNEES